MVLLSLNLQAQFQIPEYAQNFDPDGVTVYAYDLGGGYQQVADSAAKADIPSAKRALGMAVSYVHSSIWVTERFEGANTTNTEWHNESNWIGIGVAGGIDSLYHADTKTWLGNLATIPKADSARDEFTADVFNIGSGGAKIYEYEGGDILMEAKDKGAYIYMGNEDIFGIHMYTSEYYPIVMNSSSSIYFRTDIEDTQDAFVFDNDGTLRADGSGGSTVGNSSFNNYYALDTYYGDIFDGDKAELDTLDTPFIYNDGPINVETNGNDFDFNLAVGDFNVNEALNALIEGFYKVELYSDDTIYLNVNDVGLLLTQGILRGYGSLNIVTDNEVLSLESETNSVALISNSQVLELDGDTLRFDGSGNSDSGNIKAKNFFANFGGFFGRIFEGDTAKVDVLIVGDSDPVTEIQTSKFIIENTEVDKIQLNDNIQPYSEGTVFYDSAKKAITVYNDLPDFGHQLGYEHVARYYNNTGSTIENGTFLRPFGQKINGDIFPTVKLAGNGSYDSLLFAAMSTTTTLDESWGVVTLIGPVNELDLSEGVDNGLVYIGHAGGRVYSSPETPLFSKLMGQVFYADDDSGQVYLFPEGIEYDPSPHIAGDTSVVAYTVDITVQNQFELIPIGNFAVEEEYGFTLIVDSIRCDLSGYVTIVFNTSFIGNTQSDTWRIGVFINGVPQYIPARTTSSSDAGNLSAPISRSVNIGDYVSFRVANTSDATRDPEFTDISYEIIYLHR